MQYRAHEYNQIIENSRCLANFYSGASIGGEDHFFERTRKSQYKTIEFCVQQLMGIKALEVVGEDEDFQNDLKQNIVNWLIEQENGMACYIVRSDETGYTISYGSCSQAQNAFQSIINGFHASETFRLEPEILSTRGSCGFVINLNQKSLSMFDNLLRTMQYKKFSICFVSVPILEDVKKRENEGLNTQLRVLRQVVNEPIRGINRLAGNYELPGVGQAIKILEQAQKRLEKVLRYLYVCITAEDAQDYREIVSSFKGTNRNEQDEAVDYTACLSFERGNQASARSLPYGAISQNAYGEIWWNQFASVCTVEEVASWFMPPTQDQVGYTLHRLRQERSAEQPFGIRRTKENLEQNSNLHLGSLDSGEPLNLAAEEMKRHMLVVGSTAAGKTTTMCHLLHEADKNGIHFVVIEAAKKHYWPLLKEIPNLKVYSVMGDALPFCINPFRPEPGTLIDTHIQGLTATFLSVFQQEEPMPQIISELVYRCYEDCNIRIDQKATDDLSYPTIQNFFDLLDDVLCIYDGETAARVRGYVKIRLNMFKRGMLGKIIREKESFSFHQLKTSSLVVELEGLDDKFRTFLGLILALRANEFFRSTGMGEHSPLKNLLVIEEAHRVLSQETKATAELFTNMMAELSSFGVGMIVVDQRPSILPSGVIANTGVKILHSLWEGDDIRAMQDSLGLKDEEVSIARTQKAGRAIISIPGEVRRFRTQIENETLNGAENYLWRLYAPEEPVFDIDFSRIAHSLAGKRKPTIHDLLNAIEEVELLADQQFDRNTKIVLANRLCVAAGWNIMTIRELLYQLSK